MATIPTEFNPRFLEHLDGRTVAARILRDRLAEMQSDLGGEESLSYAQKSLCRRALWLESVVETMEATAATGQEIDLGKQVQALNSLLGIYRTLGLRRQTKDVSLGEFLKARKQAK